MKNALKRILKTIAALLVIMIAILAVWTGLDAIRFRELKVKALSVQVGDTLD